MVTLLGAKAYEYAQSTKGRAQIRHVETKAQLAKFKAAIKEGERKRAQEAKERKELKDSIIRGASRALFGGSRGKRRKARKAPKRVARRRRLQLYYGPPVDYYRPRRARAYAPRYRKARRVKPAYRRKAKRREKEWWEDL